MEQPPLVAIVPSPGMGHLIPLVEFAKLLVARHRLHVSFFIPSIGPQPYAQKKILESLSRNHINSVSLPEIDFSDLPHGVQSEVKISLAISRSIPSIRDALKGLILSGGGNRSVYLIVDMFGTDAFDVAREFDIKPFLFFLTTPTGLSLVFELHKLDEMGMPDLVQIPGSVTILASELPDPIMDSRSDAYKLFLHHVRRYKLADGILINSFLELEPEVIKYLEEENPECPPVYPIGPLIQTSSHDNQDSECLTWLDGQPPGSVLFVAFGSGGTLSIDQIKEVALGLEMSKKRFLWVVKSPNDKIANGAYFDVKNDLKDPLESLPHGFLDRTRELGLVVTNWAPQVQILSHGSTGGFVTHCGWNSVLESIVHGVPLIAWPLYAEQRMNAVVLEKRLNVALRPKVNETGLVTREEIARVVSELLDGEDGKKIGDRVKEVKMAAAAALSDGGSSTTRFADLILKLKSHE